MKNNIISLEEFSSKIGVSTATVSSVFNNRSKERRISPKTVELVKLQARKLGYQPNVAARRLRVQKDMKVCELVVVTAYESPFAVTSNLVKMLEQTAAKYYKDITPLVEIVMFHRNKISEVPGILDGSRFNGAIITNTGFEDDSFFMENRVLYPIVFLGREIPGYSCVTGDAYHMGTEAAEELICECKCEDIAVITPRHELLTQTTKGRLDGFLDKCVENEIHCAVIEADDINEKSGAEAIDAYLKKHNLDGLFCVSDMLAVGSYYSIKNHGFSIPEDIAVVGIGDVSVCEYLNPPLTLFSKVNGDMKDEYAAKMLLEQIYGQKQGEVSRVFHASLVRNGSSMRL
ncbi:MAG: LacI family DNA-binding transcriptional regulator [Sedimentisphaeraceae bacterium JB056]